MNDHDEELISEPIPVPPDFYASDTGKPFTNCMVCNQYLLQEGVSYMIEKAIKQHAEYKLREVIFEYALCMGCVVALNEAISEESKERIASYFAAHVNLQQRREQLLKNKPGNVDGLISNCLIKNSPISESAEYQMMAQCDGGYLLFTTMPFAISFEAMSEISDLLSEKTLGEMDDFTRKYFSGPPEIAAILKKRLVFV